MSDDETPTDDHDGPVEAEASGDEGSDRGGETSDDAATGKAAEAKASTGGAAKGSSADRKVTRRTVVSRRVTPKGGAAGTPTSSSKARDARKTETVVTRTPPPAERSYPKGPSPWWVPTLMFALLIVGALIIMLNYMVGDSASNTRLIIGLAFILGGIITATQYR